MTAELHSNIALLIDGDNAHPHDINDIITEVAKYGVITTKRIYGNWPRLRGLWQRCQLDHSILPIQNLSNVYRKNSTDIAMVIDAMDLLYTGRYTAFCLVSSDSDFARLAARIRESGLKVFGFGKSTTPRVFVTACTKFIFVESFAPDRTPTRLLPAALPRPRL